MKEFVISLLVGLVAGFGGGWAYQTLSGGSSQSSSTATTADSSDSPKSLEECLTEVWGADKYAAISANASLATTEDNFQALACYEAK
jgi:hypothetical protein